MSILRFSPKSAPSAEHEMVQRIAAGDARAMEEFHRRYFQRLYRYVLRVTHRADLVDEIVNDVMFAVWKGAGRFRGRSKVSTWLLGIAYRQALKALEREKRHRSASDVDPGDLDLAADDGRARRVDLRLLLETALESLSPEHRAVVELTYFAGYSYPEIAEIVGCPPNTVKTRMFHARRRLRRILELRGVDGIDDSQEISR